MFYQLLPLLFLLEMTSFVTNQETDVCADNADGCSIPLDLPFFFKNYFEPSCNRHDICYACGVDSGISRRDCDRAFYRDMRQQCNELRRRRRRREVDVELNPKKRFHQSSWFCKFIAYLYFRGVRAAGEPSYKTESEDYCSVEGIDSCLPS